MSERFKNPSAVMLLLTRNINSELEELPETATEEDIYEAIYMRLLIEKRYHQIDEGKFSSTSDLLKEMKI